MCLINISSLLAQEQTFSKFHYYFQSEKTYILVNIKKLMISVIHVSLVFSSPWKQILSSSQGYYITAKAYPTAKAPTDVGPVAGPVGSPSSIHPPVFLKFFSTFIYILTFCLLLITYQGESFMLMIKFLDKLNINVCLQVVKILADSRIL